MEDMKLYLASASPRRREILEQIGAAFEVMISTKEENTQETEPDKVVFALSRQKTEDVCAQLRKTQKIQETKVVLGADTIVSYRGEILGKPKDAIHAMQMIQAFAGKTHEVYTGVTIGILKDGEKTIFESFVEKSVVKVSPMTQEEIASYIETNEFADKAGAYAIQGKFAPFIEKIEGDYYNIVGFPIAGIYRQLKTHGIDLRKDFRK